MEQAEARANREKERADQEKERADQEKEQKNQEKERADQSQANEKLRSGLLWATLQQLESKSESTEFEAGELDEIGREIAFFKTMLPPLGAEKKIKNPAKADGDVPRNQHRHYLIKDIWGNDPLPNIEVCHVYPHGGNCNRHWNPLLSFFVGRPPAARTNLDTDMLEMLKAGYSINGRNVCHSSLNDSTANLMLMRAQFLMDCQPSFLMLPLMNTHRMNAWTNEPYRFVFIPVGSYVFEEVKALTPAALSGAHTISSRDPLVIEAVASFSLALRVFVNVMKLYVLTDAEKLSAKKHFADMLGFVHKTNRIPVPRLPDEELLLRLGSFEAGVCPGPGGRVNAASLHGHPATCPWLLQARNANSWFTFLWSKRGLGDERFLGDRGLEAVETSARPSSAKLGCVLFPACSDVAGFASCDLCLSRHVCANAWMFPDLSPEETEAVRRIRASSAEEGDAEALDALRRTLFIDVGDFPDSDDDDPAVPGALLTEEGP